MRETSASKPLLTHRKPIRRRQNRRRAILPGSAWKVSYLLSMWRPVWRRRDSHSGFLTERENLADDERSAVRPRLDVDCYFFRYFLTSKAPKAATIPSLRRCLPASPAWRAGRTDKRGYRNTGRNKAAKV